MSTAAATVSARAAQPVLTRAGARASATLNALAALAILVANLVAYGKTFVSAFRAQAAELRRRGTGRLCGTADVSIVGPCLRRGVLCGLALYKALWRDRAPPAQRGATARADWHLARDLSDRPMPAAVAGECHGRAAGVIPADMHLHAAMTTETAGASRDEHLVPDERRGFRHIQFSAKVDRCKAPASRVGTPRFEAPPESQRPGCLSVEEQLRDLPPPPVLSAECPSRQAEPCAASGEAFAPTETAPALNRPVSPSPAQEVATTAMR